VDLQRRRLAKNPSDTRALLALGDAYVKLERYDKALSAYERAAELYYRGELLIKAIAVYRRIDQLIARHAPGLAERFAHTMVRQAEVCARLGLSDDAIAGFDRAVGKLRAAGRERDAALLYKRFVALLPGNPEVQLRYGEACARLGDIDQAVELFAHAARRSLALGRSDRAIVILELLQSYRAEPRHALLLAELYLARASVDDAVKALAQLQLCFKNDPEDLRVLALLARAFELLQSPAKADEVRKAAAWIALRAGAREHFEDLVSLLVTRIPEDEAVRELVALLNAESAHAEFAEETVSTLDGPTLVDEPIAALSDEEYVTVHETTEQANTASGEDAQQRLDEILREAWTGSRELYSSPPPADENTERVSVRELPLTR
jgi:tetratricopeptide (TPR) repeat protein